MRPRPCIKGLKIHHTAFRPFLGPRPYRGALGGSPWRLGFLKGLKALEEPLDDLEKTFRPLDDLERNIALHVQSLNRSMCKSNDFGGDPKIAIC